MAEDAISSDEEGSGSGKKDWYQVLIRSEKEIEELERRLTQLTVRVSERKELLRKERKQSVHIAREKQKARDDLVLLDAQLKKVKVQKSTLTQRKEGLSGKKQLLLRQIQNAREGVGEAKLVQKILLNEVEALEKEKKHSAAVVRSLHEELSSLDQLAGELHGLLQKENKKRKVLKATISEKIKAHEHDMQELVRRVEYREGVAKERQKLLQAQQELRDLQEEQQKMYVDGLSLETMASNREVETGELRRQLKALWVAHQELYQKTEDSKKKLYSLEGRAREANLVNVGKPDKSILSPSCGAPGVRDAARIAGPSENNQHIEEEFESTSDVEMTQMNHLNLEPMMNREDEEANASGMTILNQQLLLKDLGKKAKWLDALAGGGGNSTLNLSPIHLSPAGDEKRGDNMFGLGNNRGGE
mmetsp:Transcript_5868/g.14593  ORF Transcript_5868/g.14593 Transcript_5868/m.14593 type:complete len:417 (-) Transcript_5868:392-1642(-)|eukprot:g4027.t1